jgi:hypothetical protein
MCMCNTSPRVGSSDSGSAYSFLNACSGGFIDRAPLWDGLRGSTAPLQATFEDAWLVSSGDVTLEVARFLRAPRSYR